MRARFLAFTCRKSSAPAPSSGEPTPAAALSSAEVSQSVTTPASVPVARDPETRCQDMEETAPRNPPSWMEESE
eukprot:scaffold150027_cov24-Tisochrysis_lutea.AAC.1